MVSAAATAHAAILAGIFLLHAARASAQQYFTEDARIAPNGTCVFQFWYGERDSWVEPECTIVPHAELSLGVARVHEPGIPSFGRWAAELKLQHIARKTLYISTLAGLVSDPESMSAAEPGQAVYAFAMSTELLWRGRITLTQNLGWTWISIDNPKHALLYAARMDTKLIKNVWLVTEAAGLTNEHTEYQVGLSALTLKQKLQIDLSYGGAVFSSNNGQGWTIAVTVTGPAR